MSETCIVCLGDLGENASALPLPADEIVSEIDAKLASDGIINVPQSPRAQSPLQKSKSPESDAELIAHLLPCGHNLHDECLKPWVERANSCPICRQIFNQVELTTYIGGPAISSYAVQDRTQVADVDPLLVVEDEDEQDWGPCRICGTDDHDDVLLLCDQCNAPYHTYCVSLSEVPVDSWCCESCAVDRAIEASLQPPDASYAWQPSRRVTGRTLADARSRRRNFQTRASEWARVWETIFDQTSIDIDFPYYNETEQLLPRSQSSRHRERRFWEGRLRVAEEQGGSRQLRHIASSFSRGAAPSRPRPAPEEPESMEEIMAWNAMEKARDIEADPTGRSRKRRRTRSVTSSPSSPLPPPDPMPRKRPRTRRPNEVQEPTSDSGEASNSRHTRTLNNHALHTNGSNAGPSFLQSLLREVESSTPVEEDARGRPRLSIRAMSDHGSPQGSSPEVSPVNSAAPSPRATSASPAPPRTRPGSPALTSRIEPIYPYIEHSPDLSPISPTLSTVERPKLKPKSRADSAGQMSVNFEQADGLPTRAKDQSPTRASMPLSTKEKIQKLVKDALREPYQKNQIDKDQYTDINRNVSRMLYDKIGETGHVDGGEALEWRHLASLEVGKAVTAVLAKSD